jgi:hypothetical protein
MSRQSEIFARYRSLLSTSTVTPTETPTARRLNNMDFVDFLFELVRTTKGQKQFKNVILKGSLSKLKKSDELNKIITNAILSIFGCDNNLVIPTKYTTKSSLGIELFKSEIDSFGLLAIDPNSDVGKLSYEGNDLTKHLNYFIYSAQNYNSNAPISIKHNDNVLFELYSSAPDNFIFKFGEFYENKLFSNWLVDYLSVTAPIFNNVNFTTALTDIITGAVSIKANKSKVEIRQQSAIIKACKKIFGFCTDPSNNDGNSDGSVNNFLKNELEKNPNFNGDGLTDALNDANNEDPFNFTVNDLKDIENEADLKSRGVIRFATCGDLELKINADNIFGNLQDLFNNSNLNSLYGYGEDVVINDLSTVDTSVDFDNSTLVPDSEKSADFFDNAIKEGALEAINEGEDSLVLDLPSINSELQLNILKAIPYALMRMVLTPKILMVPKLFDTLSIGSVKKPNTDFVKKMKPVILKVGSSITTLLIENIFNSIKSDFVKLAKQLALAYLKQRGLDYLSTLRSLLKLLGIFSKKDKGCGGILAKLLNLLKLSNFGPMPMLPPPLIFLAGSIKPGMNSVALVNEIKSNLTDKGIDTAPTLPDGTPNNMIIAIEETVKSMVTHIKTNSTIQTFGISAAGPVAGYGQIQ